MKWHGEHPTGGRGVSVIAAKPDQCRWPLGGFTDKAERYCGDPVQHPKTRYCPFHYPLAYARLAKT